MHNTVGFNSDRGGWGGEEGKGWINGDARRLDSGWWTHNTMYRQRVIEPYT